MSDPDEGRVPTDTVVASGSSLEGVVFQYPAAIQLRANGTNLSVLSASRELLELRFPQPVAYVHIGVEGNSDSLQLRGNSRR